MSDLVDGRYKIRERWEDGATSELYAAQRLQDGKLVVLKRLKAALFVDSAQARIQFREEAVAISQVEHPQIVRLLDSFDWEGLPCLVTALLRGETLAARISRQRNIPIPVILQWTTALVQALAYVHERGIVHLDIKPSNLFLEQVDGEEDALRLLDFGTARLLDYADLPDDVAVGTFCYMSPEAAGILGREPDERSDLYAVGVVLYRLLTDFLPFAGSHAGQIVHRQATYVPQPPSLLRPGVTTAIDGLVGKLLEKEPDLRYQSATGLLADLRRIAAGEEAFPLGEMDRKLRLPTRTRLLGRETELRQLSDLYRFVSAGKGSSCLIHGEAGTGKSSLVESFRRDVTGRDGLFLTARCLPHSSAHPYGAFAELLDAYLHVIRKWDVHLLEREKYRLETLLGDFGGIAVRINHNMSALLGQVRAMATLESEREQRRFLQVLAKLFLQLAPQGVPVVLLIEDIQWMDESGLLLLQMMATEIGDSSLLLLMTQRDGDISAISLADFLQKVQQNGSPLLEINLRPFDLQTMQQYVADQLGVPSVRVESIAWRLQQAAMGNPCFAASLLRAMVEEKALVWNQGTWREDAQRMRHLEMPGNLVELLVHRLEQVSALGMELLVAGAVVGRSFTLDQLAALCGRSLEQVLRELEKAVSRNLVRPDVEEGRPASLGKGLYAFTHERVREAVLTKTPEETRKNYHFRMIGLLSERVPEPSDTVLFQLADHAVAAQDATSLRKFALPAAERASAVYANLEALRLLEALRPHLTTLPEDRPVWLRVERKMADLCQLTGRYDEGVHIVEEMLPWLSREEEKAELLRLKGMALFRSGLFSEAENALRQGLDLVGEKLPVSRMGVLLRSLRMGIAVLLPTRTTSSQEARIRTVLALYLPLGWKYVLDDLLRFMDMALRTLQLGRRHLGPSAETGRCLSTYGSLLMAIPIFKAAHKIHDKGIAMRKAAGDVWGEAQGLQLKGYGFTWSGRNEESLPLFRQALQIYEKIGDEWEQGVCWNGLTNGYLRLCAYPEARQAAMRYLEISEKTGDAYGTCTALANLCLINHQQGRLKEAEGFGTRALALARNKQLHLGNCFSAIHLACALMHAGRASEAVPLLEEAQLLVSRHPFIKEFSCHVYTHLAEARLLETAKPNPLPDAPGEPLHDAHGDDGAMRKELLRLSKKAMQATRPWPNRRGDAERIRALVLEKQGRFGAAMRLFKKSLAHNTGAGRLYPLAQTHRDIAGACSRRNPEMHQRRVFHLYEAMRLFRQIGAHMDADNCAVALGLKPAENSRITEWMQNAGRTTGPQFHSMEGSGTIPVESHSVRRMETSRKTGVLLELSRRLSALQDWDALVPNILDAAMEWIGAQRGALFLYPQEGGPLAMQASQNLNMAGEGWSRHLIEAAEQTGQPIVVSDTDLDPDWRNDDGVRLHGIRSMLAMPIQARGKPLGFLYLDNRVLGGLFEERHLEVLAFLAGQAGIALENARLFEQAGTDALTGLFNRSRFENYLGRLIGGEEGITPVFSLLVLDIDHFKRINDTLGHLVGDAVLRQISQIIAKALRKRDAACRFGGEEFAVALPETDSQGALLVAEKMRTAIAMNRFANPLEDREIPFVTISIGIAEWRPGLDRITLFSRADTAMYRAKEAGRNRTRCWEGDRTD